jgi:hypothetical protein
MQPGTTKNAKTRYKVIVIHISLSPDVFKSSQIFTQSYNNIIWCHTKELSFHQHLLIILQRNHTFCQVIITTGLQLLSISGKVKFFAITAPVPVPQIPICACLAFMPHNVTQQVAVLYIFLLHGFPVYATNNYVHISGNGTLGSSEMLLLYVYQLLLTLPPPSDVCFRHPNLSCCIAATAFIFHGMVK